MQSLIRNRYLLLAYDNAINVYSTATSLIVRRLRVDNSAGHISSFTFSSTNPAYLYLSTDAGVIEVWDWLESKKMHQWSTNCHTRSLTSENVGTPESPSELIYTIDRKGMGPWMISAHQLLAGTEAERGEVVALHKSADEFTALKVIEQGKCIIATCGASLVLGTTDRPDSSPLKGLSYTWRGIECPEWISSFDIRVNRHEKSGKAKRQKSASSGIIDIAVGGLKGTIHIFHDLQNKLVMTERQPGTNIAIDLSSRKHHWHRNAVLTCKWSLDGMFIVAA